MRRLVPIMTGLAIVLASGAHAQQSASPPSEDAVSGAPVTADPPAVTDPVAPAVPPAPVADAPVNPPIASATPPAPAADQAPIQQMGPPQEVAQAAPPPAQSYPPCSRNMQDSCRNPDPKKELPYYKPSDMAS